MKEAKVKKVTASQRLKYSNISLEGDIVFHEGTCLPS